jgi:hypothetical protein
MSNDQPKKKAAKKVVTTESIEKAFSESQKGFEEFKNNKSGVIDYKKLNYTLKMANKAIREMGKLMDETFKDEKMAEDLKKKNKDYLKKKMG